MPASARRSVYFDRDILAPSIAVMDQPTAMDGSPRMKRLFQGIEKQSRHGLSGSPASRRCGGHRRR